MERLAESERNAAGPRYSRIETATSPTSPLLTATAQVCSECAPTLFPPSRPGQVIFAIMHKYALLCIQMQIRAYLSCIFMQTSFLF